MASLMDGRCVCASVWQGLTLRPACPVHELTLIDRGKAALVDKSFAAAEAA
jgi:hypothetical protein